MKTYFLALRNEDFSIVDNKWTSSSIDLYANKFYTNYSTTKSPYGNNIIGNYTFTGLSIKNGATPSIDKATTVTDYGEIIQDQNYGQYYVFDYDIQEDDYFFYSTINSSTPYRVLAPTYYDSLYRFVDTSSNINIVRI